MKKTQIIDSTQGIELTENREIELRVEYHNREVYNFSGKTKKEAYKNFLNTFLNLKGFVKAEFRVYDSDLIDYVEN